MIKCIECGKLIEDGDTRYVALHGSYCQGCWEKEDQKFKVPTCGNCMNLNASMTKIMFNKRK